MSDQPEEIGTITRRETVYVIADMKFYKFAVEDFTRQVYPFTDDIEQAQRFNSREDAEDAITFILRNAAVTTIYEVKIEKSFTYSRYE